MSHRYQHPILGDIDITTILRALGEPARLEIVRRLDELGEANCANLLCNRPKSSMSHHFQVLRESGILRTRIEGVQHRNTLRREELDIIFPGLMAAILAEKSSLMRRR